MKIKKILYCKLFQNFNNNNQVLSGRSVGRLVGQAASKIISIITIFCIFVSIHTFPLHFSSNIISYHLITLYFRSSPLLFFPLTWSWDLSCVHEDDLIQYSSRTADQEFRRLFTYHYDHLLVQSNFQFDDDTIVCVSQENDSWKWQLKIKKRRKINIHYK